MFDERANAAAVKRVARRINERHKTAFDRVLSSEAGRAFLMELAENCHLYDNVESPEDEGARRVVVAIRNEAESLGLIDKWQQAEKEAADFRLETKNMLSQTESKEEYSDEIY